MCFADEDRLLAVQWDDAVLEVFRLGRGINAVSKAYSLQAEHIMAVSPRHLVAMTSNRSVLPHMLLIDLLTGNVLQELSYFSNTPATFTPDGLHLLICDMELPTGTSMPEVWKLSPLVKEVRRDPIDPFPPPPPTGPSGRFVKVGAIQGPVKVCNRHLL